MQNNIYFNKVEIIADNINGLNDLTNHFGNTIATTSGISVDTTADKVVLTYGSPTLSANGLAMLGATTLVSHSDTMLTIDGKVVYRVLTYTYDSNGSLSYVSKLSRKFPNLTFILYKQSSNARFYNEETNECYTTIHTYKRGMKYKPTNDIMSLV